MKSSQLIPHFPRAAPAVMPGLPITEYSRSQLVALASWILSDTLLRTDDDLLSEMVRELGFGRRGHRIVATLRKKP